MRLFNRNALLALIVFRNDTNIKKGGLNNRKCRSFHCPPRSFVLLSVGGQPPQKLRYFQKMGRLYVEGWGRGYGTRQVGMGSALRTIET